MKSIQGFLVSLILISTLNLSVGQQEETVDDAVDPNASGLTNCNKCTKAFLKLSPFEQAIWKKYLITNKGPTGNGPSAGTHAAFQTMSGAASFNHPDIETLEMEEKNLVKYYLNDLKLARGGEELREKINSLHQTLVTAYAWKLYQEQMMDTDQFELLANNQKPVFSKVESKQIEDSFNKTDNFMSLELGMTHGVVELRLNLFSRIVNS